MARSPLAKPPTQKPKGANLLRIVWFVGFLIMWAILSAPSLLIFALSMLPTLVAFFIDRTKEKYAVYCVGSLNFCGTLPFVLKLFDDHSMAAATDIMTDVFVLAVIYSAAAFGWLMFIAIPPVVSTFLTILAQKRVKTLKVIQKQIVEEWGPEVAKADDDATIGIETKEDERNTAVAEQKPQTSAATQAPPVTPVQQGPVTQSP